MDDEWECLECGQVWIDDDYFEGERECCPFCGTDNVALRGIPAMQNNSETP